MARSTSCAFAGLTFGASTYNRWFTTACDFSSRESDALFCFYRYFTQVYIPTHTHTPDTHVYTESKIK